MVIFDVLGLSAPESDGFSASGESLIRWSDAQVERLAPDRHAGGLVVDRGKFDAFLIQAAKVNGVHVFQPARITKVERTDLGWRFEVEANNGSKRLTAKFVVDAAGRRGFLPRKRRTVSPRTLALCGYVSSETCPTATLVEPLQTVGVGELRSRGVFSAMVFLDQDTVRAERRDGLEFIWRSHLAKTKLFSGFSVSNLIAGPIACDATTFFARIPFRRISSGRGSLFALDPLSSTGVEKALQNGLVAATALHTMLARPDRKELCARFYRARQNETVSSHASWSSDFYRRSNVLRTSVLAEESA